MVCCIKKANYELIFDIDEDTDDIISSIINIFKTLGINYKKIRKTGPKTGERPKIDIEMVEYNIRQLETLIGINNENDAGIDEMKILMDLYQKVFYRLIQAIEYYSATNDPRYQSYLSKLTKFIKITSNHKNMVKEEVKITPSFNEKTENIKEIKESKYYKIYLDISKEETTDNCEQNKEEKDLNLNDGIVIDDSENLPNFDDGNESSDSN